MLQHHPKQDSLSAELVGRVQEQQHAVGGYYSHKEQCGGTKLQRDMGLIGFNEANSFALQTHYEASVADGQRQGQQSRANIPFHHVDEGLEFPMRRGAAAHWIRVHGGNTDGGEMLTLLHDPCAWLHYASVS